MFRWWIRAYNVCAGPQRLNVLLHGRAQEQQERCTNRASCEIWHAGSNFPYVRNRWLFLKC